MSIRSIVLVFILVSGASACKDEGRTTLPEEGGQDFQRGGPDAASAGSSSNATDVPGDSDSNTSKLPCVDGGTQMCRERFGANEVCLAGFCDSVPPEPCQPGSCPPHLACANNLDVVCEGCPHATACLVPGLCRHVSAPDWTCVTPDQDAASEPAPSNEASTGSSPSDGFTSGDVDGG